MDLIERAPDSWHVIEAAGESPSIRFYYGVRWNETHLLPVGAQFGVVSSPNYYVHPQSPLRPWAYTVFEVSLFKFREFRPLERAYKQVHDEQHKRRQLMRFEVEHFEALWTEIVMMGSERMMA